MRARSSFSRMTGAGSPASAAAISVSSASTLATRSALLAKRGSVASSGLPMTSVASATHSGLACTASMMTAPPASSNSPYGAINEWRRAERAGGAPSATEA